MKLTEAKWSEVFELRCKAKRGIRLNENEQRLVTKAWQEDPDRYRALESAVFNATKPFGST